MGKTACAYRTSQGKEKQSLLCYSSKGSWENYETKRKVI
jgi:hypothetical protein